MKKGKIRIVTGWILVILQVFSLFGLNSADMKLWDDGYYQYTSSSNSNLNFVEWCFAFEVGNEKFTNSFGNMFGKDDEYSHLTANEYASSYIRESLGSRDEDFNFSLFLFDFNILTGYMFYGILGLLLLVFGYKAKNTEIKIRLDDVRDDKAKKNRIICVVLLCLAVMLEFLRSGIGLVLISLIFLLVFFGFYIGVKKSLLLSSAIILFAVDAIWHFFTILYKLLSMETDSLNVLAFPSLILAILSLIMGIIYLICGTKLYQGKEKKDVKKLNIIAFTLTMIAALGWPILLSVTYDTMFVQWIEIPDLIFAVVATIYITQIPYMITRKPNHEKTKCEDTGIADFKEQVELQDNSVMLEEHGEKEKSLENCETEERSQESSETKPAFSDEMLFCRKCGARLLTDSAFCDKCGTKVEYFANASFDKKSH